MAVFDVSELIEMAVRDEETGVAFYTALAKKAASDAVKKACEQIARQEEHHRDRFRAILEQVGEYEPYEEYAGQYESYVRTLLDEKAFPEPEAATEKARAVGSDREAIEIAMRMERDTLLFLQEVKSFLHQKQSPYIDEIIEEERQHLVDLASLKKLACLTGRIAPQATSIIAAQSHPERGATSHRPTRPCGMGP